MNNDSRIPGFCTLWLLVVLAGVLGTAHTQAASTASLPDVTPLLPYAVFGNQYELVNATTVGSVGISNAGQIAYNASVSISGRLDLGIGATVVPLSPGATIGGGIRSGLDLSAPQSLVASASAALAALTATSPQTSLSGTGKGTNTLGSTNAVDDVQVFNLTSLTLSGNRSLNLSGDPGDFFVINVLDMNVMGRVVIGSAAQAEHTFVNVYDSSNGDLGQVLWGNSQLFGTLLIPYGSAQLKGTISGAVWSGPGTIALTESARVINVPLDPPAVPDAAGTSLLMVFGGGLLLVLRRFTRFD